MSDHSLSVIFIDARDARLGKLVNDRAKANSLMLEILKIIDSDKNGLQDVLDEAIS